MPTDIYTEEWITRLAKDSSFGNKWYIARNFDTAVLHLQKFNVTVISLDHDLGEESKTGYDLAKWMTQNNKWPEEVHFHSANPVGVKNMADEYAFYLKYKDEMETTNEKESN